jgi:glycerate kinase
VACNVLIAPDKFKGTLTAQAAAQAIARGWRKARPADSLTLRPISDGGDGFGATLGNLLCAKFRTIKTVDAAHRPCRARWWWEPKTKTAVIESANIIGLAMLPAQKFHPFALDTYGLGAVIRAAQSAGARRCLIGIGGSATNDAGFGLARALGWKFLDRDGHEILRWTALRELETISPPKRRRWFPELIVAVDVQNPLLGLRGATHVFGPQKGLRTADCKPAETNLRRLARIFEKQFGGNLTNHPGYGAAGGLGFGLAAFLGARLEPGFDLFARIANLDRHLRAADLVITGEGRIDRSTLMGKGVGQLARRCRQRKIPRLALAGELAAKEIPPDYFTKCFALTGIAARAAAKARAAFWLERLAQKAAADFTKSLRPAAAGS